jgi:hypothetical protein
LITVRHHGFGLAQRRRISADHGHHAVGTHRAFGHTGGARLVRAVIVEDFLDGQLLSARLNEDASSVINLLDGELNALALILAGLGFATRDRHDHADFDFVTALSPGR